MAATAPFLIRLIIMTNLWKSVVVLSVVMFVLLAGLTWVVARAVVGQFGVQTYEGYFAPIYSPDGQYVYFIERRTSGTTKQTSRPSIMMDNPPRYHVSVMKDTLSLKRLHVRSGKIEELVAFSPSPLEGQSYESVGNRFQFFLAGLKFTKRGQVEFNVYLKTQKIPTEKEYWLCGVWTEAEHAAKISSSWEEKSCGVGGYNEWPIFGDWELQEVHGEPDYFSNAIVAYNHVTGDINALVKNNRYHGVTLRQVEESSRRQEMERQRGMRQTREELEQKYKAIGMGEYEMYFRIMKDMEQLGYYPKSTIIVARRLSRDEAARIDKDALFSIAKDEMESGIFQDIEKAVASPGEEIEKDSDYPIHRDYTTSARLNAYLQSGKRQFYVRYLGETYEMTIKKP